MALVLHHFPLVILFRDILRTVLAANSKGLQSYAGDHPSLQ
jgi:hypothetical protein